MATEGEVAIYEERYVNPARALVAATEPSVRAAMFDLFSAIGVFWGTVTDSEPFRLRLYNFMENRIDLDPLYEKYYLSAAAVLIDLLQQHGNPGGYEFLFTDPTATKTPPLTPLAITRQKVANEFIALQMSLGGFLAFGAKNAPGFFGGVNDPSRPPPYRPIR